MSLSSESQDKIKFKQRTNWQVEGNTGNEGAVSIANEIFRKKSQPSCIRADGSDMNPHRVQCAKPLKKATDCCHVSVLQPAIKAIKSQRHDKKKKKNPQRESVLIC